LGERELRHATDGYRPGAWRIPQAQETRYSADEIRATAAEIAKQANKLRQLFQIDEVDDQEVE
jgi:hypothetical protein